MMFPSGFLLLIKTFGSDRMGQRSDPPIDIFIKTQEMSHKTVNGPPRGDQAETAALVSPAFV